MKKDENLVTPIKRDDFGFIVDVENLIANANDRSKIFNENQNGNAATENGEGEPQSTQGRSFKLSDEKEIG